jgi:NADPH:quinone reductase-like Zn-dependent oxidoreductase
MGVRTPKRRVPGGDFAGTVEEAGPAMTDLKVGDEVFGVRSGAFAEHIAARRAVVRKPENVTFEEAAAVPVAGLTALQGLRDHGGLRTGQRVLINGASGGVGTFAVQIAKAMGAEVTAVCSTGKVEQARELGADRVIDYTTEDFTRGGERYDVLFDNAGSRSWPEYRRVLADDGAYVGVGIAGVGGGAFGLMRHIVTMRVATLRARQRVALLWISKVNRDDLQTLAELLESGKVRPAIDRRYPLAETPAAMEYVHEGHARGKVVIVI